MFIHAYFACNWVVVFLDLELQKMTHFAFRDAAVVVFFCDRDHVIVDRELQGLGKLSCGAPQGSVLGLLLSLLYVNDMPQSVSCKLLLYADDTCLICMGKGIKAIEDQLNKDFNSLCEWFIDNKHFGEEKTKSILFGTIKRLKHSRNLDIRYKDTEIKQCSKVTYLECILNNSLSGEAMATKVLGTIHGRLKFLYRSINF